MRARAIYPVGVSGRSNHGELRRGFVRIGRVGIGEQAGRRQFPAEREDPFGFGKRRIIVIHMGAFEQFSDHALVDLGILPEIEGREVESECLDRSDEAAKRAALELAQ